MNNINCTITGYDSFRDVFHPNQKEITTRKKRPIHDKSVT